MPRGIYKRTANQLLAAKHNLAKGRSKGARVKAAKTLRQIAKDPAWREKVSSQTIAAMHRPDVRIKHLEGLARSLKEHGVNFKGGNGQEPCDIIKAFEPGLTAQGYSREFPIKTKGHGTGIKAATCYKVDFGNPLTRHAIEFDGQSHKPLARRAQDLKKDTVLKALGWTVLRIKHD